MPLIGIVTGGVDLSGLELTIGEAKVGYGLFLQNVIDFIIVAFCIFIMIKTINKLKKPSKEDTKESESSPVEPSNEEKLLSEIRDLLKDNK